MDEELGRHDVQALAHVLPDARHRAAAAGLLAVGAVGLVAVFDAPQMIGQRLTARLTRCRLRLGIAVVIGRCFQTQLLQLGAQALLVLDQRFLAETPLLGVHRLGAGAELPALQSSQLEGDLLDLGIAPDDVAVLALQQVARLGQLAIAINRSLVAQGEKLLGILPTGDPGRASGGNGCRFSWGKSRVPRMLACCQAPMGSASGASANCIDAGAVRPA